MAALTVLVLCGGQQIIRIASVFVSSGFSVRKCANYVQTTRQQHLFERYLKELKMDLAEEEGVDLAEDFTHIRRLSESSLDIENIEVIEGVEMDSTFYDNIDPNLVFTSNSLGKLHEGVSFTVKGHILLNCERFSVNLGLDNHHKDIALHINPRLPQNYIVRNCRVKNVWGQEEVTSALPFILRRGSNFNIQILITEEEYLISVNGRHFASFSHRLPYQFVTCLEVKGDVEKVTMERNVVTEYPNQIAGSEPQSIETTERLVPLTSDELIEHPTTRESHHHCQLKLGLDCIQMPYYGSFVDLFDTGKMLLIEGRVKILPHSFFINLQKGHHIWPHPLIPFHFNPRFANLGGKHVICRNSWINGKWDKEERTELKADFLPGNTFTLAIFCTNTAYEVFLNDKFISEYKFRLDPSQVDTLYIQGDVKLNHIVLKVGRPSEMHLV